MTTTQQTPTVGALLRDWRQRRHLSQLELSSEAAISARHLSFLETGRSLPSREMLLHLAAQLDIPLRERNMLLLAAGYAPIFSERSLDDPALQAARRAVDLVLKGHEPYPALALDRYWTLVAANRMLAPLLAGVDTTLTTAPINVLRLSLHPAGLAPRIANFAEWRAHLFARLRHQIDVTADRRLIALLHDLEAYPTPHTTGGSKPMLDRGYGDVVVPLQLRTNEGVLSLLSTTTVFGTPVDVTLAELAIESFFPADDVTGEILRRWAAPH